MPEGEGKNNKGKATVNPGALATDLGLKTGTRPVVRSGMVLRSFTWAATFCAACTCPAWA